MGGSEDSAQVDVKQKVIETSANSKPYEGSKRFKTNCRSALTRAKNRLREFLEHPSSIAKCRSLCDDVVCKRDDLEEAQEAYVGLIENDDELKREQRLHQEIQDDTLELMDKTDKWLYEHESKMLNTEPQEAARSTEAQMQQQILEMQKHIKELQVQKMQQPRRDEEAKKESSTQEFTLKATAASFTPSTAQPVYTYNPSTFPSSQYPGTPLFKFASPLPEVQMLKFKGDPTEFANFKRSFETRVTAHAPSANDCLFYLHQCLEGEAQDLISGCLYLDGESGFSEAMRLLNQQYGQPHIVCNAFMQKLSQFPAIKQDDPKTLKKLYLLTNRCNTAMKALTDLAVLDFPANLQMVVSKLPTYLRNKWRDRVSRSNLFAKFADLVLFLEHASAAANDPIFGNDALFGQKSEQPSSKSTSIRSMATSNQNTNRIKCRLCNSDHELDNCMKFRNKSIEDKRSFLRSKGLCFRCLYSGHMVKDCKRRISCAICHRSHATSMHMEKQTPESTDQQTSEFGESNETSAAAQVIVPTNACRPNLDVDVMHAILPVRVCIGKKMVQSYAFYDSGSSASFITHKLMHQLDATGPEVGLKLTTMHGRSHITSHLM